MVWYLVHIVLTIVLLWPAEHFLQADLGKPLVFIPVSAGIFIVLWLLTWILYRPYFVKPLRIMRLVFFFIRETVKSNFKVAYDIITPGFTTRPAIIAVPLKVSTDNEILALASLINLTPGTLVLEIPDDKRTMYVHEMYVPGNNPDTVRKNIREGFEKMIMEISE